MRDDGFNQGVHFLFGIRIELFMQQAVQSAVGPVERPDEIQRNQEGGAHYRQGCAGRWGEHLREHLCSVGGHIENTGYYA